MIEANFSEGILGMAKISKWSPRFYGPAKSLIPRDYIVVRVASFQFGFRSVQQLRECIKYYEQKIHPSSRVPAKILESQLGKDWREQRGWEVERWFERLPMYLLEEPKRQKVLKALNKALKLTEAGKLRD